MDDPVAVLVKQLDYLGGSLAECLTCGYLLTLSPRLRDRLVRSRGERFERSNELSAEQIAAGTDLTRALGALYRQEATHG